jgi:hypothetical protein
MSAWLEPSPYGGYTITGKWRVWALLACCAGTAYQMFKPVEVYWNMRSLTVRGGVFQRSIIPLAELGELQLLPALSAPTRRISGYEIAGRKRGTFEVPEWGTVDLFLDGSSPPYLLLPARGNARTIVVNESDPAASLELFERVQRETAERRQKL